MATTEMTEARRVEIEGELLENLLVDAEERGLSRREAAEVCRGRLDAMALHEPVPLLRLAEALDTRITEA